jgi:hypothetical protein
MRFAVVVIALLGLARSAHAADGAGVGVVVSGAANLEGEVGARIESGLRQRGYSIVAAPLSSDAVNTLMNCFTLDDMACARGVFEARSKPDRLVFVRLDVAGKNVTFNVYWFAKGKEAIGERRVCEKCDGTAWHGLTDAMVQRLVGDMAPAGSSEGGRASRLGPSLVLGAGVAMMAAGGILLYYGARDGADQKYIYPDSTPVGIGVGTVGLGATIGGAIWLWQSGESRSGPVARATRGGAYVGWGGRF